MSEDRLSTLRDELLGCFADGNIHHVWEAAYARYCTQLDASYDAIVAADLPEDVNAMIAFIHAHIDNDGLLRAFEEAIDDNVGIDALLAQLWSEEEGDKGG